MKTILGGQEDRPPLALRYQWRRECKTKKDGDTRVSMEPPPLTLIRRQGGCLFMNNTDVYPAGLGTLRDKRGAEESIERSGGRDEAIESGNDVRRLIFFIIVYL